MLLLQVCAVFFAAVFCRCFVDVATSQRKVVPVSDSLDEDYEELLERLKVVSFSYTEYLLEEVIYQLAKIMFTQSLTRGSTEAQSALHNFTAFLEAEQGHTRTA